ncbi:acyltransferase [Methanosarcina sp.]|uniref:acyltransferase family protein n=1 Tax=Methanosarcina sp. TaxID=2213 RepID=UPI002ABB84B8|nr:acyltransferase [Methanosarcina sp.]MDY9927503.1 acyltransferase [Methanosarcina sp.]
MREKIEYLDSLRGIAALVVIIFHFAADFYPALLTANTADVHTTTFEALARQTPLNVVYNGSFAVCVFFVLSGYVLTYKYFQSKDNMIIISGAIRRYFRLLGPILTSILLAYLLLSLGMMYNQQAAFLTGSQWLHGFYQFNPSITEALRQAFYYTYLVDMSNSKIAYNAVLWTMNIEFRGSFLVFTLALFIGRLKNRYPLYLLALFFTLNTYYMGFVLGLILADIYNSDKKDSFKIKNRGVAVIILLMGLFLGGYIPGIPSNPIYNMMTFKILSNNMIVHYSVGASLLLLGLLNLKGLQEILSHHFLVFIGKLSFSLYVVHRIIITSYSSWLFIQLVTCMSYFLAFVLTFLSSMVVIFVLGYLMYCIVDVNSVKLSRLVYNNLFNPNGENCSFNESVQYTVGLLKKNTYSMITSLAELLSSK